MSVQRWKAVPMSVFDADDDGRWVLYDDHAAEVARLTAELEESRKLHASALRLNEACSDWAFQRDRHNEEIARLREALWCDVCVGGNSPPASPCICGGTGQISDTLRGLRRALLAKDEEVIRHDGVLAATDIENVLSDLFGSYHKRTLEREAVRQAIKRHYAPHA